MKKRSICCLILVLMLTGCAPQAVVVGIPRGYRDKQEYYDKNGFQDYTDYAKYVYPSPDAIVGNRDYRAISEEDVEVVSGYFENFRGWMSDRLDQYDFDDGIINEGDYVRIEDKDSQYGDYSVYFFDIETLTLYYIHNNI